mmetsp:Transcript_11564/g.16807  ORF Transcript_11564/g.16807 Transcript_11564/m.16807 type:complete len:314 (-) Transcript_11564:1548-2489(-)
MVILRSPVRESCKMYYLSERDGWQRESHDKHIAEECESVDLTWKQAAAELQRKTFEAANKAIDKERKENPIPPAKRRKTSTGTVSIKEYFRKITVGEKNLIDEEMSLAFVTGNIPWNFLMNENFKAVIRQLRPNYTLLDHQTASNQVLPRLNIRIDDFQTAFIGQADNLTLQTDGTKNVKQNHVCNWVVVDGKQDCELLSIERGKVTDTAIDCFDEFNRKADKILPGMKIDSLLHLNTDSAGVLVAARTKLLEMETCSFGLIGGCLAHQSNLLMASMHKSDSSMTVYLIVPKSRYLLASMCCIQRYCERRAQG